MKNAGFTKCYAISSLLLLAGCNSTTTIDSLSPYQNTNTDQMATVILSVRYDNRCKENPYIANLFIENISNNEKSTRSLNVYNKLLANDFDNPPGYFYVQNWPAGQYHISQFKSVSRYSTEVTLDMNVYFTLRPGTVNYLGQFLLTIPNCGKYSVSLQDDINTALTMLEERESEIDVTAIKSRVRELYQQIGRK